MKNLPLDKLNSLIALVKGKNKKVAISSIVVFLVGIIAVKYGIIPESLLNIDVIVNQMGDIFKEPEVVNSVVAPVIDSVKVEVVDSIVK